MNRATGTFDTALEIPDFILFDSEKILVITTPREQLFVFFSDFGFQFLGWAFGWAFGWAILKGNWVGNLES